MCRKGCKKLKNKRKCCKKIKLVWKVQLRYKEENGKICMLNQEEARVNMKYNMKEGEINKYLI